MQPARNVLLVGIAAAALAAGSGLAVARQSAPLHDMTVRLPDGEMARIQYRGNVAPHVTFVTHPFAPSPVTAGFYGPDWRQFAALDRISAEMNREMDALMNAAEVTPMPAWPNNGPAIRADLAHVPPGTAQYAFISTQFGNAGFCAESMTVMRGSNGGQPKIVTHRYGHCGPTMGQATLGGAPYVAPNKPPQHVTQVNARQNDHPSAPSLENAVYRFFR